MSRQRQHPIAHGCVFRKASHPADFEAIHRLNHRTFAEEIPQHDPRPDGRLVDRFHEQNHYHIAMRNGALAAMVALRFDRPFSVEQKAPASLTELPAGHEWCEIRLLAIEPRHRGGVVLAGLLRNLIAAVRAESRTAAMISATTRQLKLYAHLGFQPFGPLIGREGAWYQPMWITLEGLLQAVPLLAPVPDIRQDLPRKPLPPPRDPINLLPGPVSVSPAVEAAFHRPAVSHRSPDTLRKVRECREFLCRLTGAAQAYLLAGGGTLANDVVAAHLRGLDAPGLVLVSGEFGRRLAGHARGAGLRFEEMPLAEGTRLTPEILTNFLDRYPGTGWCWLTHCETSTGILQDLPALTKVCGDRNVRLCADCVSSLGAVSVDLAGVWMASATSGKALAAFPGVALVLTSQSPAPSPARKALPRTFDLSRHEHTAGMPSTLSSNAVAALHAALHLTDWPEKLATIAHRGRSLRRALEAARFQTMGTEDECSPAVITLTFDKSTPVTRLLELAAEDGYLLAGQSDYLIARHQIQICLMGHHPDDPGSGLPGRLSGWLARCRVPGQAGGLPADGDEGRAEIERLGLHG